MIQSRFLGAFLFVLILNNQSSGVTIDFESLAHSGTEGFVQPPYFEDGYTVSSTNTSSNAFGVWGTASPHYVGSTAIFQNVGALTTLVRDDGGPFDVLSIDISKLFSTSESNSRILITFDGIKSDSSTVKYILDVPKHFGLVTYPLPGMTDIVHMEWDQSAFSSVPHQFDNIVVIPEPSSLLLLLWAFTLSLSNNRHWHRRMIGT